MNKKTKYGIGILVAVWLGIFIFPAVFVGYNQTLTAKGFIASIMTPFAIFVVFIANLIWLTPYKLIKKNKLSYFAINSAMIFALAIGIHVYESLALNDCTLYELSGKIFSFPDNNSQQVFYFLSDIIYMVLSAAIATAIALSTEWMKIKERKQLAEQEKADMEKQFIRYEMQPHFLLNTLNNIYSLTTSDTPKAQDAIFNLSNLLRYMLYDSKQPSVDLQQEVNFIKSYIDLMSLRLSRNVEVTQNIQIQNAENRQVVPLIFISTIENAFKHGVSPTEDSYIHVSISADDKQICCMTENSYFPKNKDDKSGHGIGRQQTENMLKLSYPGKFKTEYSLVDNNKKFITKIIIYDT